MNEQMNKRTIPYPYNFIKAKKKYELETNKLGNK